MPNTSLNTAKKLLLNMINKELLSNSPAVSQYLHSVKSITLHNHTKLPKIYCSYYDHLLVASSTILLQLPQWMMQYQ